VRSHFIIKALSETPPWGSLLAAREKEYETRSWQTRHRGWVAIHASKMFPDRAKWLCWQEPFLSSLIKAGIATFRDREGVARVYVSRIPTQAILGIGFLADCIPTEELMHGNRLTGKERSFGDFSPDRWAWRFERVIALPDPIPCKGDRGLWTPPADVCRQLEDLIISKVVA